MIDLETIMRKIEETGVEERTTKELKEYGLNDYYIKKAVQEGRIEKIDRGKYKIIKIMKDRIMQQSFHEFKRNIFQRNFSEAYDSLYTNMINQTSHDHDNQLILYFTLLKEILSNEKDFSFLDNHDNLLLFGEKVNNKNSYYQHYTNFKEAVLSHNFEQAYYSIDKFTNSIKKSGKQKNTSISLFLKLTEFIMRKKQENKKENEIKKTPHTKSENPNYDIDELTQLIYDREYEKVQSFLESRPKTEDNRTFNFALRLIKKMNDISNHGVFFQKENPNYLNSEHSPFKRFFEALKFNDYEEAYKMVLICEELAQNKEEFTIYHYIIEDILESIRQVKENNRKKKAIIEINKKISNLVHNRNLTEEDINTLETLIKEKLKLCNDNEIIYNNYYLEMLDVLKNIKEKQLVVADFEHFSYNEKNIEKRFFEAISQGDFKEALDIINNTDWYQKTQDSPNRRYFPLYKNLLLNIENQLNQNKKLQTQQDNNDLNLEEDNQIIIHLENIRKLIKERKFKEAYLYYQCNNFESISENLNQELHVILPFLENSVTKEEQELILEYKKALSREDFDQAEQYLQQLEAWINLNGAYRTIDYYKDRLSSNKKETTTEDFVKKEQLYDAAVYYYYQKKYQESIDLLNEYIEKDQDLSAKGYLLRGRNYEYLKKFKEARENYQKAIAIIPEPNAYHRLGKTSLYNGNQEEALEYFLECEKRKPGNHYTNLQDIYYIYKNLGNEEESEKYKQLIKMNKKEN